MKGLWHTHAVKEIIQLLMQLPGYVRNRYHSLTSKWNTPNDAPTTRPFWAAYHPAALVAVIGAAMTFAAFMQSLRWENSKVEIAFREASQDRILVVQRELKYAFGFVQDIASFIEASDTVGRREYRKFVGPALKRQIGIKALEWVPVVQGDERTSFVNEARKSFPPFQITAFDSEGKLIKSDNQPFYYPVLYVQPYQYNKQALGLDMAKDPVVSALLKKTRKTLVLQVSPIITMEEAGGTRTAIIVAIPVYFENAQMEDGPILPPPDIRGFALGIFYIGDIIEHALQSLRSGGIDLHFFHGQISDGAQPIYTHLSRLRKDLTHTIDTSLRKLTFQQEIRVGNEIWEVLCFPAPEEFQADSWNSWFILSAGSAFTLLLTIYLASLVGRAWKVRSEVEVRTSQLQEVVEALNREVYERKAAEQKLQRLNETLEQHIVKRTAEAERRAQYLEQFAYVASHDLKAPLRAVSNLAQWIEEDLADKLDDASREQLGLLRDRVRRMHELIEGLLDYSRVGRTSDAETDVDTRKLLNEIIDSLSPPKGFKIKIQEEMPTLYADRLQLGQVFSNLISNSLKHHGGKKGKIRVSVEEYGEVYEFAVCDDGQGIAPEYHAKVFMIFQTLESSDYENSTGIGLALVKKIVEENGGTIRLDSVEGGGACFYFTWPK